MPKVDFVPGHPCWFEIETPDQNKAKDFYAGLFGWEYEEFPMGPDAVYIFAKKDGATVAAIGPQPEFHKGMDGIWNFYIATGDADATNAKIAEAGGKILMEPFEVPGNGKMGVYADPTGAHFATWEKVTNGGVEVKDEHGAFVWCECTTRGIDKAAPFYEQVFGWKTEDLPDPNITYKTFSDPDGTPQVPGSESTMLGGFMEMEGVPQFDGIPPHWMTYFAVEDTDKAAEYVRGNGGAVLAEPFSTPYGRIAVLADPTKGVFSVLDPHTTS